MTPSSTIAAHTAGVHTTDAENSPSPAHGLQNVFTETVLLGSDNEDEEVEFSYGTETLQHSLSPQAGLHGFPDALISLLSCHQFGFTRDFLHDAGAHFKMQVMKFWDTSLHIRFASTHAFSVHW